MARKWINDYIKSEQDVKYIGGKALHLFKLQNWGLSVPPFGVLSTESFKDWKKNGQLSEETLQSIEKTIGKWNSPYFAVRSSMSGEDSADASYAGMMDTFLFVPPENLEECIIKCFQSIEGDRVKLYEGKKSIGQEQLAAVVIQKMLSPETSGVAFGRAPVGNSSFTYIESCFGLGEGLVSGLVEVDCFWADRFDHIKKRRIEDKKKYVGMVPNRKEGDFTKIMDLPPEKEKVSTLSDQQVVNINQKLIEIEEKLEVPADIEWAYENNELFLLQVRPITQKFPPLEYFIDTNLSESYPGLTSPLSGGFVKWAYYNAFLEMFEYLSFSQGEITRVLPFLKNLVTRVSGHMYYVLDSYYAVLKILPGGEKNIENWHRMIGGRPVKSLLQTQGLQNISQVDTVEKFKIVLSLLKMGLFHGPLFRDFCKKVQFFIDEINKRTKSAKTSIEMSRILPYALKNVRGFGLTVINDFLIMGSIKGLVKILDKYGYGEEHLPALIKTDEGVESLLPLQHLTELCWHLKEAPQVIKVFENTLIENKNLNERELYELIEINLKEENLEGSWNLINQYLQRFGERSFEELKIECLTFDQSPSLFLEFLKWKISTLEDKQPEKKNSGSSLPQVDFTKFSLLDRIIIGQCIKFAHKTISMREKTRLLRGKVYGLMRRVILEFFYALKKEEKSFCHYPTQAVFGLSMENILDYAKGKVKVNNLKNILEKNKDWMKESWEYPEFLCMVEDTSPFFQEDNSDQNSIEEKPGEMCGQVASPGDLEGVPLVLINPREAMKYTDLKERILVTKTTDPSWVFIMGQCKGLISEKGSLLSHTAIIGRELGIPTIVGVKGAVEKLKHAKKISIDGKSGKITIIS
ncbi:PEP-utilizing enzyme [Bacteriovoracales bacterium]|nr:PEP-utilizing enzyme [Bacteriovoracales bacterium]